MPYKRISPQFLAVIFCDAKDPASFLQFEELQKTGTPLEMWKTCSRPIFSLFPEILKKKSGGESKRVFLYTFVWRNPTSFLRQKRIVVVVIASWVREESVVIFRSSCCSSFNSLFCSEFFIHPHSPVLLLANGRAGKKHSAPSPDPTFSQFQSLKIRRLTFVNLIKLVDWRISRLRYCVDRVTNRHTCVVIQQAQFYEAACCLHRYYESLKDLNGTQIQL